MTQTTTTAEAPATITEQELFAAFANMPIRTWNSHGGMKKRILSHEYTPDSYLREYGEHGELEGPTEMLADNLYEEEFPSDSLQDLINGLEYYVRFLKIVSSDFHTFMHAHQFEPDFGEEPSDPVEKAKWEAAWDESERNPRFLVPRISPNLPTGRVQTDRHKALSRARELGLTQAEIDASLGHGVIVDRQLDSPSSQNDAPA